MIPQGIEPTRFQRAASPNPIRTRTVRLIVVVRLRPVCVRDATGLVFTASRRRGGGQDHGRRSR